MSSERLVPLSLIDFFWTMFFLKWVKKGLVEQDDVVLLKDVIHFYSFVGNYPPKKKYKWILLTSYHIVSIIMLVNMFLSTLQLSIVGYFIYIVNVTLSVIFSLISLKNSHSHKSLLHEFFSDLESFDCIMKRKTFYVKEVVHKYYWKYVFGNVFYIIVHASSFSTLKDFSFPQVILITYFFVVSMQIFVTASVLKSILDILERRYDFLIREIKQFSLCPRDDNGFWASYQLKACHLLLTNLVEKINEIFGHRILLILIITLLSIIGCFQWAVFESSQEFNNYRIIFSSGSQVIIFWVSIINMS